MTTPEPSDVVALGDRPRVRAAIDTEYDDRCGLEVVDDDGSVLVCFQFAEVAGYAIDPPEGAERP